MTDVFRYDRLPGVWEGEEEGREPEDLVWRAHV
jgi:hypothetical protein